MQPAIIQIRIMVFMYVIKVWENKVPSFYSGLSFEDLGPGFRLKDFEELVQ